MLPRSKRLNLTTNFKWVSQGKKIDTPLVKLFLRAGNNDTARVGIAVSTRFFKKASLRNRVKRRMSAVLEKLYPQLPANINMVVLPKDRVVEVKSVDILLDLKRALQNEKIIHQID